MRSQRNVGDRVLLCDETGGHSNGDGPFPGHSRPEPCLALEGLRTAVVLGVEAAFLQVVSAIVVDVTHDFIFRVVVVLRCDPCPSFSFSGFLGPTGGVLELTFD